jgi:hypothetical protein
MHVVKHKVFVNVVIAILAGVTCALSIVYTVQLWRAPISPGLINMTTTRAVLVPTYILLPVVTILASAADMVLELLHRVRALYTTVTAAVLTLTWLLVVIIWGQCHGQAHINPDNPWLAGT